MGKRGKELTQDVKNIIINLNNTNHSSYKISEITGLNRRTVSNFLKRFLDRGNTENLLRSGRQRKLDDRAKRRLVRMVRGNRRQTLEDLTSKFNNSAVVKVSSRTVRRRLFESEYKRHVVSKTISIRKVNRSRRMGFCRQKLHWNVQNNWSRVIFSDETKIIIGEDKKIYVWRKSDERLMGECTGIRSDWERQGVISAMFWGCITYNGVGTLTSVEGNMNSNVYIDTLNNNLWPVVAKNFGNGGWIFQEDNAPCHVSRVCNDWKTQNNIPVLPWPAQSPDINVIENVWRVLKIRIKRRLHDIKNKADLERIVHEIWSSLPLHYIRSLYQSLPKRIRAVLKAKGHITKY